MAARHWHPDRVRRAMRLYLVTDPELGGGRPLVTLVRSAVLGGVTAVQLRDKGAGTRALVETARALKAALHGTGVPLIVNDRLDVVLASGADGLHLGQSDLELADARRHLPSRALLGLSVESVDQVAAVVERLRRSQRPRLDYLGLGPIFATGTKPDAAPPVGIAAVTATRALTRLPLVAIGGVDVSTAGAICAAGADGVAVVSAIMSAADPAEAARALAAAIDAARTDRHLPST